MQDQAMIKNITDGCQILEDYYTQLQHLRAEIEQINQEFVDWQKEQALGSSRA